MDKWAHWLLVQCDSLFGERAQASLDFTATRGFNSNLRGGLTMRQVWVLISILTPCPIILARYLVSALSPLFSYSHKWLFRRTFSEGLKNHHSVCSAWWCEVLSPGAIVTLSARCESWLKSRIWEKDCCCLLGCLSSVAWSPWMSW
jgi:hypothetical protein